METTTIARSTATGGVVELRHIDFRAMDSDMRAVRAVEDRALPEERDARCGGPAFGDDGLAQARGWFAEWEAHLSRFRDDSELAHLNAADGRRTAVSAILWDVVQAALQAARWTDGLVTPTLLSAVERAGYDRSFEGLVPDGRTGNRPSLDVPPPVGRADARVSEAAAATPVTRDAWRAIRTDPLGRTVTLPAGVRLDLGGIAKGWAADAAARRLAAHGPALVDAGGDIAVSGPLPDGGRWPIAVGDPRAPDAQLAVLWLAGGGVATSGTDFHRWQQDGQWRHHIIDPRTGVPAVTDVISATVIGRSAVEAEAAAKAALIQGSRAGMAWIERHPALAALMVGQHGEVHNSRRLERFLGG